MHWTPLQCETGMCLTGEQHHHRQRGFAICVRTWLAEKPLRLLCLWGAREKKFECSTDYDLFGLVFTACMTAAALSELYTGEQLRSCGRGGRTHLYDPARQLRCLRFLRTIHVAFFVLIYNWEPKSSWYPKACTLLPSCKLFFIDNYLLRAMQFTRFVSQIVPLSSQCHLYRSTNSLRATGCSKPSVGGIRRAVASRAQQHGDDGRLSEDTAPKAAFLVIGDEVCRNDEHLTVHWCLVLHCVTVATVDYALAAAAALASS